MTGWLFLSGAIFLEVSGTISMKYSEGFRHLVPSLAMILSYIGCFTLLTMALKTLELGLAYAVWAGLGTALIVIVSLFLFHEPINLMKVVSIVLIIAGVVGLNMSGAH